MSKKEIKRLVQDLREMPFGWTGHICRKAARLIEKEMLHGK